MSKDLVLTDIFGTPFFSVGKSAKAPLTSDKVFTVRPYLQLGREFSSENGSPSYVLYFGTSMKGQDWSVEYRCGDDEQWRQAEVSRKTLKLKDKNKDDDKLYLYRADLNALSPSNTFQYRISKATAERYLGNGQTPSSTRAKIAVVGDMCDGGKRSRKVARAIAKQKPELLVAAGDIVYNRGRVSEYLSRFFPTYNHPDCAQILSSTPLVPVAGNHDIGLPGILDNPDFASDDALGILKFFETPANGPRGVRRDLERVLKKSAKKKALETLKVLPKGFLRHSNYSFCFSNMYFLVLDANIYMDWSLPELQQWVSTVLSGAPKLAWKIVVFHQAAFSLDFKYANDQHMRTLCPIFEQAGVSLVFSGHCHYYERTYPLRYLPSVTGAKEDGTVPGTMILDKSGSPMPDGVTYVITGAGGKLTNCLTAPSQAPFAARTITDKNSFTSLEASTDSLVLEQLSKDGEVLDRFVIKRLEKDPSQPS